MQGIHSFFAFLGNYPRKLAICLFMIFLVGCATPSTRQPGISKEALAEEERYQKAALEEMLKKHEKRLNHVAKNLFQAAQPLCKKGNCSYPVQVKLDNQVNAYADGKKLYVTSGMMRFADKDEELALVLSHELAHNVMGHIDAKMKNAMLGMVFDVIAAANQVDTQGGFSKIGAQAYSQAFELEADYIGLYILARAGWPIEGAPQFWRKMGIEFPASIRGTYLSTHPSSAKRFILLDKTIQEIREKRRQGLSLLPEKMN